MLNKVKLIGKKGLKIIAWGLIGLIVFYFCVGILDDAGVFRHSFAMGGSSSNGAYISDSATSFAGASASKNLGFGGFLDSVTSNSFTSSAVMQESAMAPSYNNSYDYDTGFEGIVPSEVESGGGSASNPMGSSAKLTYSADLDMETKDMNKALEDIKHIITDMGGFVENERVQGNVNQDYYTDGYYNSWGSSRGNAYLYVRIPTNNYENFITALQTAGDNLNMTNISKSVEDLTRTYYDKESRLRSLRTQEERLLEFMRTADSVSDMLEVERRLTDVQYEIDSVTNALELIDYKVDFSQVNLSIRETPKYTEYKENPKNFFERLIEYFEDSGSEFLEHAEEMLAAVIYLAPYAIIVVIVVIAVKKVKKMRKEKKENKSIGTSSFTVDVPIDLGKGKNEDK